MVFIRLHGFLWFFLSRQRPYDQLCIADTAKKAFEQYQKQLVDTFNVLLEGLLVYAKVLISFGIYFPYLKKKCFVFLSSLKVVKSTRVNKKSMAGT